MKLRSDVGRSEDQGPGASRELHLRVRGTGAWEGRLSAQRLAPGRCGACGPIPQALVQTPGFVMG